MLSIPKCKVFSLVAEALTGLIYHRSSGENSKFLPSFLYVAFEDGEEEDSDVDFEAKRRSTRVKRRFALPYSWPNINSIIA